MRYNRIKLFRRRGLMSHRADFLHSKETSAIHRAHKRRRLWPVFLLIIVGVVLWWVILVGIFAWQLTYAGLDSRDALLRAKDSAIALNFDQASYELAVASERLQFSEGRLKILRSLVFIPWVKEQLVAGETLVHSGRTLLPILSDVVDVGSELVRLSGFSSQEITDIFKGVDPSTSFEELSPSAKQAILLRLSTTAEDLVVSKERISLARQELARLRTDSVAAPIVDVLLPIEEKLASAEEAAGTFSIAARLLPELAGVGTPKNLLLLFLNNAELRPGGGFIGTYGTVIVHNGDFLETKTQDVYKLDDAAAPFVSTQPPEVLRKYLGSERWFFRDSNWSPDFSVSAQQSQKLFQQESAALPEDIRENIQPQIKPDMIVGFTPDFAAALLNITGPIEAGGQVFTADNFFQTLEHRVEFDFAKYGDSYNDRKAIVSELVEQMKKKLFQLDSARWVEVLEALEKSLSSKQLVFYSNNPSIQEVLEKSDWAGRVIPETSDQLMVVDANLASLKTDPKVSRDISYSVFYNSSKQLIARTAIRYKHNGAFTKLTTRYRSYTRVYAPLGSELIRVTGSLANDKTQNPGLIPYSPDTAVDLGMTSFGAFVAIEPGETRELVFEYVLPQSVAKNLEANSYSLEVFKQVGADDHSLTLNLDFDKKLASASPAEVKEAWGDDVYNIEKVLDRDLIFRIGL